MSLSFIQGLVSPPAYIVNVKAHNCDRSRAPLSQKTPRTPFYSNASHLSPRPASTLGAPFHRSSFTNPMRAAVIARRGSVSTSKAISFGSITTARLQTQRPCGGLLSSPRTTAAPAILSYRNTLRSPRLFTTTMAPSSEHVTPGTGAVQNAWIGEKGTGAFDLRSEYLRLPVLQKHSLLRMC